MKIKVSELKDVALDWAMAKCEYGKFMDKTWWSDFGHDCCYSTDWAYGGPIIERERISLEYMAGAGDGGLDVWVATRIEGSSLSEECAPTPLVAAMRCYVAAKLGDEVDVPDELTGVNK